MRSCLGNGIHGCSRSYATSGSRPPKKSSPNRWWGDYRAEHPFTVLQSPAAYRSYQKLNRGLRSRDAPILGGVPAASPARRPERRGSQNQPNRPFAKSVLRSEQKRSSTSISPELCLERLVPIFTKFGSTSRSLPGSAHGRSTAEPRPRCPWLRSLSTTAKAPSVISIAA